MEPHPVPQNVTAFEFRLVGDMTLKQFAYLATGLGISYLIFNLWFASAPAIAIPLILLFSGFGAAFAFMPISDRPLDHWVKAYFNAILAPTQGQWSLTPKPNPAILDPGFNNRLNLYLSSIGESPLRLQPGSPVIPIKRLEAKAMLPRQPQIVQQTTPLPTHREINELVEVARQAQLLQVQIAQTEKQIAGLKQMLGNSPQNAQYNSQFQQMLQHLQVLTQQAQQVNAQTPIASTPIVPVPKPEIKIVEAPTQKKTQVLLTSSPNVINGIVTDAEGNYLEGVILIVHNQTNVPVRALKTNKLGQFTGATPLPAGIYTITLEKDNLEFDNIQITLKDETLPPIEISAKKKTLHG